MSRCLAARSVDHVVLERGQVANSWRTQRWDSLRLLTPNWMTRLPGYAYRGTDPDGYLSARQVTAMLEDYAEASAAPVLTGTTVTSVRAAGGGFLVRARRLPSMQLIGSPDRTVDLNALSSAGVRLAGRLAGIADGVAQFSGSLPNVCALADLKLGRLLNTIDAWAGATGERFAPTI